MPLSSARSCGSVYYGTTIEITWITVEEYISLLFNGERPQRFDRLLIGRKEAWRERTFVTAVDFSIVSLAPTYQTVAKLLEIEESVQGYA